MGNWLTLYNNKTNNYMGFEISIEQLESLEEKQLVILVRKLLNLEAEKNGISAAAISITENTKAADEGEDASVTWTATPIRTIWVSSQKTIFQIKASSMGPAACRTEILLKDKTEIKKRPRMAWEH